MCRFCHWKYEKSFLTFSNHIQNVLCCCFCDTLQSSSDTVSENFRAKKSTRRVLLLRVRLAFSCSAPRGTYSFESHWYSGATVTTRWPPHPASAFSRDRGRGPRRFEGTFTFYSFLAEKVKFSKTVGQISLKFCQPPWNFLR